MDRSKSLAGRLDEVLLSGRWIANTNWKTQLEDLDWTQAAQRIGSLNSIASLTFHVNYYLAGLINVFKGGSLDIRDKYSFDMPPIESQSDWDKLVDEFLANSATFVSEVARLPDGKLDEPFVDEKYGTLLRNVEGVIEHSYYHLGQVSLIRKLVAGGEK